MRTGGSLNCHSYCRYASPVDINIKNVTEYDIGAVFKLNDLILPTEFTSLYDRYKITRVQFRIQLIQNPSATWQVGAPTSNTPANTVNTYPKIWYCPDYDDSSSESIDQLRQRARVKCKILAPNKFVIINVKPAILVQDYVSAISTGYSPAWNKWVDAGNGNVPYYGIKLAFDTNGVTQIYQDWNIRMERKYWFTMKDVR